MKGPLSELEECGDILFPHRPPLDLESNHGGQKVVLGGWTQEAALRQVLAYELNRGLHPRCPLPKDKVIVSSTGRP